MRILIVLAFIGVACAVPRQPTRIVGGESTTTEKYPFMSSMILHSVIGLIQFCGGTLITRTSVVSAAHCYVIHDNASWSVRLGSYRAHSGGDLHPVSRIILHEKYIMGLATDDVAIIKLTYPAVLSNKIKTARIAGPRYILPDNTRVHVIGWGDNGLGLPSEVLQHVAVYTINHQLCTERYAYLKNLPGFERTSEVTPEMMCTGILDVGDESQCCGGDSGGPVIHGGDVLVGITAWGHKCANETYPGVNMRVSAYSDWIYTNSIN